MNNKKINIDNNKSDYFKFILKLEKFLIKEQEKNNKFDELSK